jgi:hypothetical protein
MWPTGGNCLPAAEEETPGGFLTGKSKTVGKEDNCKLQIANCKLQIANLQLVFPFLLAKLYPG